MRIVRALAAAVAVLALPSLALAHGLGNKVMGTVTAVQPDAHRIDVKTADGHVVAVKVDDKTKYTRGDAAAALSDVKEGIRVVVTTAGEGDAKTATLVRLAPGTARPNAPPR